MTEDQLVKVSAVYRFAAEGVSTATFVTASGDVTPSITIPRDQWQRMLSPKFLRVSIEPCDRNGVVGIET